MTYKDRWQRLHPALDPLVPAGDPRHPELVRVARAYSPQERIQEKLKLPFGLHKELLVGAPGSGKTTELLGVAANAAPHLVLIVDLRDHFENQRGDVAALDHLQPWEVLAVVGLAILRFGESLPGHVWTESEEIGFRDALAGPSHAEPASVDLPGLIKEVAIVVADTAATVMGGPAGLAASVGLKFLGAMSGSVSASLPLGLKERKPLPDQDMGVQNLLHAVNRLINRFYEDYNRRLLLIIDGIDRARSVVARRLFEDSQLLADLVCHQVLAAPLGLRPRNLRVYSPNWLLNVPVLDPGAPSDPTHFGPGIGFFSSLWQARTKAVAVPATLVDDPSIHRLGWASGGFVRQFLEMAQQLVEQAWQEDAPTATAPMVDAVIDRWRRRWESGLTGKDIATLEKIAQHRIIDGEDTGDRLLDERCVVALPNESTWYYPHPLLTLRMVRPRP